MFRETTPDDIDHVCTHLRAPDAAEQFATRFPGEDNAASLAIDMAEARGTALFSFTFMADDESGAIAIVSAYLISPGVVRLHRIATDEWQAIAPEFFRFIKDQFFGLLDAAGIWRAECAILSHYLTGQSVLARLGFVYEGRARKRGRDGEDFCNYAWVKP